MKDIKDIIENEPVYLNDFKDKTNVILEFFGLNYAKESEQKSRVANHKNDNILFASYTYENYSGDAWVLFENNGNLFEVNGSHCSCYGLEQQWDPEPVVLKELENRLLKGTFGYSRNFIEELKLFLGIN